MSKNYYLCDLKNKSVLYAGALPPSWGNLTSLSEDNDECLKDLEWAGHPNMGFLTQAEAIQAGVHYSFINQAAQELHELDMAKLREERNARIWDVRWRVERHNDEKAMGLTPTEDITRVLNYIQALRDVPQNCDPKNVEWPIPPQ